MLSQKFIVRFAVVAIAGIAVVGGSGSRLWGDSPDKNQAAIHFNDGVTAFKANDYNRALAQFQLAVKADPADSVSYCWLGYLQMKMNQPETSILNFKKAIELNPNMRWRTTTSERPISH